MPQDWREMGRFLGMMVICGVLLVTSGAAQPQPQRARDQTAFAAARAVAEPGERVSALAQFAEAFPESALAARAEALELETLLGHFPDRQPEIHAVAEREIRRAPVGLDRWAEEARIADELASAGTAGTDLADAKAWAEEALRALTEGSFRRAAAAAQARYRLPPLTRAQLQQDYGHYRAVFLAALANVDLQLQKPEEAAQLLGEAVQLEPLGSEVQALRGQLARQRHEPGEALEDFERAEATGALAPRWRQEMLRLYESRGSAGEAGLERQIDQMYERLYPPVFALSPRTLPQGGHTVLLELFTGAGCDPCVASDLAVDSLLRTYGRQDLIALEYDENTPLPDPLTNPSSVARAAGYGVSTTPEAFLDGESLPVAGASRADVENVVVGFADAVEGEAAVDTGVELSLAVRRGTDGRIVAEATVAQRALPGNDFRQQGRPAVRQGVSEVRFALVQDHIRYSGENGVRFHRMVVRMVARGSAVTAAAEDPHMVAVAGRSSWEATFYPTLVAAELRSYLDSYEKSNDRFGEVHFRQKDFALDPGELSVVAWAEDPGTHQVLESAYAVVPER